MQQFQPTCFLSLSLSSAADKDAFLVFSFLLSSSLLLLLRLRIRRIAEVVAVMGAQDDEPTAYPEVARIEWPR